MFEVYLNWINYKGRFRYQLLEANDFERWLQSKVGLLSLPISSIFVFGLILFLSALLELIFNLSSEVAVASVVSGFLGLRLTNVYFDKRSVESFEKHCSKCESKKECSDFLNENCQLKFLKHRVKMAVQLEEKAKD